MEPKGSLLHSQAPYPEPRHHGMAHPQVADGGVTYNVEGSWEYIELAVAYSQQGVALQLGGSDRF